MYWIDAIYTTCVVVGGIFAMYGVILVTYLGFTIIKGIRGIIKLLTK